MFRFIVIFIVFACCTYMGFYFGEIYKFRALELKEIQKALNLMNTEVLYSNTALPLALLNISRKLNESFSQLFTEMSNMLEKGEVNSVYDAFYRSYNNNKIQFHLKDEDFTVIKDFFYSLGESGVYGQEKIFNLTINDISRKCLEAEEECKVNRKMYRSLGVSIGAIIAIFFI